MLTPLKSSSLKLVTKSSMYVFICSRFHAIRENNDKMTILQGYPLLTSACAGLLELRLRLLKSTFNSENSIRRLSSSIPSYFGAVHS